MLYAYEMCVGDCPALEIPVNTNGNAEDLAGASCVYVWATAPGAVPVLTIRGTITSGSTLNLQFEESDTAELAPGEYYHECRVTDITGVPITVTFIDPSSGERAIRVNLRPSSARLAV